METQTQTQLLTESEVLALFRVDKATLQRWIRIGWLNPLDVSTGLVPSLRFDPDEINSLKKRLRLKPLERTPHARFVQETGTSNPHR